MCTLPFLLELRISVSAVRLVGELSTERTNAGDSHCTSGIASDERQGVTFLPSLN